MTLVPIKIDDDLQDENSKLRALISNNFGRRKNDPAKDRKALETYVELKGYKNGEHGDKLCQNGTAKSSLDEIAKELNMSKRNLQRALRIERNLTDSMKELLDTGEITKTFASDTNCRDRSLNTGRQTAQKAGVGTGTVARFNKVMNSDDESRKDFSKAERIDYARRLERIESLKAKGRMSDGGKGCRISDNLRTDEIVAHKLGIGGKDTYRKEKYIVKNQESLTPEDFADWDEGKLSTNKAFKKIKEEKEIKDLIEFNLCQRVLGNTNSVKLGRCFQFLND